MATPPSKKQRTDDNSTPTYTLLYHAGLPGRAEPIRLLFEATGTAYIDTAKSKDTVSQVYKLLGDNAGPSGLAGCVQPFAPPMLRISNGEAGDDDDGDGMLISQTANILLYLGEKLGLAGADEKSKYAVHGLALTAGDLMNEAHDTHHPVAVMKYYEEQKEEALKKSADFRETRIPKFLGYFERVLKDNEAGHGKYLVGGQLTYADLFVWQTLDGLKFAFPKELQAREKDYPLLFETFYASIKEEQKIKDYLASERREPYSQGIFRHYLELDRQ